MTDFECFQNSIKLGVLAATEVQQVLDGIKDLSGEAFLTGSYRFGRQHAESDVDIAILISSKSIIEEHLSGKVKTWPSHYNAGFKFVSPRFSVVVNIIPLHPLEFCCWSKTAKMLVASQSDFKNLDKQTFHAIHQLAVTLAKLSILEHVNTSNYHLHL